MRKKIPALLVFLSLLVLNTAGAIDIKPGEWTMGQTGSFQQKLCVTPEISKVFSQFYKNNKYKHDNCENYLTNNTSRHAVLKRICVVNGVTSSEIVELTRMNENKIYARVHTLQDIKKRSTYRGGSGLLRYTSKKCS
ncbi:hypothetical protein [Rahnella woolbedingensis]|uniref:DUF3617 family protein n=1 Tax=Rahnella woolbedingensis TaxID=1510574 RepID=A0A419N4F3_9GAMM|nr:hypothetical protein [Rahnella woolbedingensis]RJT39804.1 hypothetical protein D6C13_19725 [Rahnella woolbedingensis]